MAGIEAGPCEAGVFALAPAGWTIVHRQEFADAGSALQWIARTPGEARTIRLLLSPEQLPPLE